MTSLGSGHPAGDRGPVEQTSVGQANDIRHTADAQARHLSPKSKRASVLRCFLERGNAGLNCFEAVRLAHDYVLRTTVSECWRYHGIEFAKSYETVPGHAGSEVQCVRYRLTDEGAQRSRELLGDDLRQAA